MLGAPTDGCRRAGGWRRASGSEAPASRRAGSRRRAAGRYRARDRLLYVSTVHDRWFRRLCELVGVPELADDPRFADTASRFAHRPSSDPELEARLAARDAADWQRELNTAGVPASVVHTLAEAVRHEQVAHRGPAARGVDSPSGPVSVGRRLPSLAPRAPTVSPSRGVPALGPHTGEILAALG